MEERKEKKLVLSHIFRACLGTKVVLLFPSAMKDIHSHLLAATTYIFFL